jgi:hypothetical protein
MPVSKQVPTIADDQGRTRPLLEVYVCKAKIQLRKENPTFKPSSGSGASQGDVDTARQGALRQARPEAEIGQFGLSRSATLLESHAARTELLAYRRRYQQGAHHNY